MDDEHPVTRWVGSVGFALALTLFLLLPGVTASCWSDSGPVHVCYTGQQLITGEPTIDLDRILLSEQLAGELREAITDMVAPPGAVRVLAIFVVIGLVAGALTALIPRTGLRALARVGTALVGVVLLAVTELMMIAEFEAGIRLTTSLFAYESRSHRPDDIVGTGIGFWLPLAILVVVAIVNVAKLDWNKKNSGEETLDKLFDED